MKFPGAKFVLNKVFTIKQVKVAKKSEERSWYMSIVRFCLSWSGLWINSEVQELNTIWISVILVFLILGFLGSLHQLLLVPQDISGGTEVLMNVSLIGHSVFTYLVLIWKRPTIMRMLALVESNFNNFTDTLGMKNVDKRSAERFNVVIVVTVSIIIFSVHLSFVGVSNVFWIDVPLKNKTLLFPISVPLEMTEAAYYLVFVLELLVTFFEAVVHITSITVCTGFINLLCAELMILGRTFRLLPSIARHRACSCETPCQPDPWTPKAHLDLHANSLLNSFLDHHTLLIGYLTNS